MVELVINYTLENKDEVGNFKEVFRRSQVAVAQLPDLFFASFYQTQKTPAGFAPCPGSCLVVMAAAPVDAVLWIWFHLNYAISTFSGKSQSLG